MGQADPVPGPRQCLGARNLTSTVRFEAGSAGLRRRLLVRLSDESGIALVMALGIMLVLTIALTSTIYLTSASQRHANTSNAGEKAYALAETGVNNAVAVLHASYDSPPRPSSRATSTLLPSRTTPYDTGSVTWSGSLVQTALGSQWPFEWRITSTGTVANPTGPGTSPVTRTVTAIVPVVITKHGRRRRRQRAELHLLAHGHHFSQSVHVNTPVYATRDLILGNTATIYIGCDDGARSGANLTLQNPQNQIGHRKRPRPAVYVPRLVHVQEPANAHPVPVGHRQDLCRRPRQSNQGGTTIPLTLLTPVPTLSCCTVPTESDGLLVPQLVAGPYFPCITSSGTVPEFDTNTTLDNSVGRRVYARI